MPAEVINWEYRDPNWLLTDNGKVPGVRKNTTSNLRGLTRFSHDASKLEHVDKRDRQWLKLGFGVPTRAACMDIGNGAVYPEQYFPSRTRDITLESSLRRQGTNRSLALMGFNGPDGFASTCDTPVYGGFLLSDFTFNDGRAQLMSDYNTRFDKFRAVDDITPFTHAFAHGQSVFESIGDPTKQAVLSQNEIKALYPIIRSPGQTASKSAYSLH